MTHARVYVRGIADAGDWFEADSVQLHEGDLLPAWAPHPLDVLYKTFKQFADPGAAAEDGDTWLQTDPTGTTVIATYTRVGGVWVNGPAGPPGTGTFTLLTAGAAKTSGGLITKDGGVASWNAAAFSVEAYVGGAFCSFRPAQNDKGAMAGLNTDPTTDASFTSIDFAW